MVNREVVEEFDRLCEQNYLQNSGNKRNIRLNNFNPFDAENKPPTGHLKPDKIVQKPGQILDLNKLRDSKPLAGRFSEIGERFFEVGNNQAFRIVTGPWNEILMQDSEAQRAKFEKTFPKFPH